MKKLKPTWIIYPRSVEHEAPEGFEGFIPPQNTKFVTKDGRELFIKHVMYYDKSNNPVFSIRAFPTSGRM